LALGNKSPVGGGGKRWEPELREWAHFGGKLARRKRGTEKTEGKKPKNAD